MIRPLIALIMLFLPAVGFASDQILPGTCAPSSSNVGEYIRSWIFCGVSLEAPADTMLGALSLILNVVLFGLALAVSLLTSLKYLWATTSQGSLGGERLSGMFGVMKVATVYALLLPVISNGFSPIQLAYNSLVGASLRIADFSATTAAKYMTTKGPVTLTPMLGLDEITNKIIEFETCAQIVRAFHASDIANRVADQTNDVIEVAPTASSSRVTISWDYVDPFAIDKGFFGSNYSTKSLCGSLKIDLPPQVLDNIAYDGGFFARNSLLAHAPSLIQRTLQSPVSNVSGAQISFRNLNRAGIEFGKVVNNQFGALNAHINRVSNIVAGASVDMQSVNSIAAHRTRGEDINAIENAYVQIDSNTNSARASADTIGDRLAASHRTFVAEMERSASLAASAAATLGTRRYTCIPTMGHCDEEEKSWADEIEAHGFAVFGSYYTKMSAHASQAMEAQKNFISTSEPSALHKDIADYPKQLQTIFGSEPALELTERLNVFQTNYNRSLNINRFVDNFDVLSSAGKSIRKDQTNIIEFGRDKIQSVFAGLTKIVASTFSSNQSGGNVITRLVTIANYCAMTGGALLALFALLYAAGNNIATKVATMAIGVNGSGSLVQRALSALFWVATAMLIMGSIAATLLPILPIIKWVIEIFSFALMLIMGLFYVPIWAFAFTVGATDDRLMTENTMSGFGLMIETLLRPTLLVISFIAFIVLMSVTDIGLGLLGAALIGVMRDTAPVGILSTIIGIFILMYVGFQFVVRSIDTISSFADQIIKRASFGTQPLGDGAGEGVSSNTTAIFLTKPYSAAQRALGGVAEKSLVSALSRGPSGIGTKP